ncbi:MAG: DNA-directed RNA polymerase subunit alpha C-terminal domain-containing protein [Pirellulaceae bacterium]|nr:DNA-directed RNA polymerase subunit alpha C-terminal domain-containing protein [Pirellulaceae bacterium]
MSLSLLRDSVQELETTEERTPATSVRLGVCYYLLGIHNQAERTLRNADGGALALFFLAKTLFAKEQYTDAQDQFNAAKGAGYDADLCALGVAEAERCGGDSDKALTILDELFGPVEQTAEYLYQRGATVAAIGGNPEEVVRLYERAVDADGLHIGALFGLALEHDRRGNDFEALDLYGRASGCYPTSIGVLLNLGILYEDQEMYDRAQGCYQRVLEANPAHPRARLFLKDAVASGDMLYDEEAQKRQDRLSQVLNVPVTDFELSVRSRNCLEKMGIRTLGDLTRVPEQTLLQSKNFGETSLVEIREMLQSKGLELGQFASDKAETEVTYDYGDLSPDEQALLDRPISDLNLSVRARKCMVRLGLNTLGELIRKTGDDMLECKNFGVTSLNEVREKLTQIGLKLRGD